MVAQERCRCRQNNKHIYMNFFFLDLSLSLNIFFTGVQRNPCFHFLSSRSFFRWIQVISSSLNYNVYNIRCLRMWHSDAEGPEGTNRNVLRSIALYSSSPPLPPISSLPPKCWLSSCVSPCQLCPALAQTPNQPEGTWTHFRHSLGKRWKTLPG